MKLSYLLQDFVLNVLDDEYFTTPYATDTIPHSPAGHQITTQDKQNTWLITINSEYPITAQGVIDELNCHKNPRVKSMVNINLCRKKIYKRIYIEYIQPDLVK